MSLNKLLFFALIIATLSCNQETNIGEVLLGNDVIELSHKNNFDIKSTSSKSNTPIGFHITTDSFNVTSIVSPYTALIGSINDPIFGKVTSTFYSRIVFNPNTSIPSFANLNLDSAVMTIAYDTLGFYGNKNAVHQIKIEAISEDFKNIDTIYSDKTLSVEANAIGTKSLVPAPKDSITILSHTDTTNLKIPAQIRIRMDYAWADALIKNPVLSSLPTDATAANDVLNTIFRGIKISSEASDNSILGLGVSDNAIASSGITKLNFYFTDNAGVKSNYQFYLTRLKWNSFELDYGGSQVELFLNNDQKSDSLIFFQTMGGINSYIDLKDLIQLEDKVINHAELEFTVANLPGDNTSIYSPVQQLIALHDFEGERIEIEDLSLLRDISAPIISSFGGDLVEVGTLEKYKFNITRHLKSIQKRTNADTKIYFEPDNKINRVARSVIYGPKHSTYPVKLRITYTEN